MACVKCLLLDIDNTASINQYISQPEFEGDLPAAIKLPNAKNSLDMEVRLSTTFSSESVG